MTSAASPNRVAWIDAAKGLGIILIVLGHLASVEAPSAFYVYIYAFHVPLFFFISGLTLKPGSKPFGSMLGDKARTLLVPYFCYALLGYAFYLAGYAAASAAGLSIEQFGYGPWRPLWGVLYGTLGEGRLVNTPMWFVVALFCTFVIGYLINTAVRPMALRWAMVLALAAAGIQASRHVTLPWSLSSALVGLVFFQAGHTHARRGRWPSTAGRAALLCVPLLALTLASGLNGFVTLADMVLGHPLLYLVFAFAGTYATVLLVQALGPGADWLAWLGQRSMAIMVIHMLIIRVVKVGLSAVMHLPIGQLETQALPVALTGVVTAILLVPSVAIMERFLPWTLGKKRRVTA